MRLTVRLFGDLRRHLPKGRECLEMDLPPGTTPAALLREIGIHPGEVWVVRANREVVRDNQPFTDGDFVELFEPVGGGR